MAQVKGGDKLAEALKDIASQLSDGTSVDVGFMGNATEEDGTPVALVAALNEYGVPSHGQPPRPFFRIAIEKNAHKWPKNLATALKRTKFNAKASLGLLGLEIKEEVQDSIRKLKSPPLAESTVRRKGFSKPLIETSIMLNTVTFKVNTK